MKNWLNGSKDKIPRSNVSFVDVRDTALAHLKAIQVPEAHNPVALWADRPRTARVLSAF